MSIQNALKLIHRLREEKTVLGSVEEMQLIGAEKDLSCTVDELETAFNLDYHMRWAKFRSGPSEEQK